MAVPGHDHPHDHVDAALQAWRQGDCVLGEHWFIHRFDPAMPLTEASAAVSDQGVDLAESAVRGLVVLTQTCDIVRASRERGRRIRACCTTPHSRLDLLHGLRPVARMHLTERFRYMRVAGRVPEPIAQDRTLHQRRGDDGVQARNQLPNDRPPHQGRWPLTPLPQQR